ncbi:MAG: hypothetical protein VZR00_06120 [Lachnospiraceae bacterium]|nr:hypothetical protein [Lachnospiraceae bacterium]MEE3461453.1 hypothetical protein [Lachnospiraceae bacterium]
MTEQEKNKMIQTLKDCGCSMDEIKQYTAFAEQGLTGRQKAILLSRRKGALSEMHMASEYYNSSEPPF